MESGTTSASLPQGGQAVNSPQLALRVAGCGLHHVHWTNAPVEGREWAIERDFATVWGLDNQLRPLLAQMLAGPALYEAIKEAHHALVCVNGLYASDRYPGDVHWRIAVDSTLGVLDAVLRAAEMLVVEGEVGT